MVRVSSSVCRVPLAPMKTTIDPTSFLPVIFANYLTLNEYELATRIYESNYFSKTQDLSYIHKIFENEKNSKLKWYLICEFLFHQNLYKDFVPYIDESDLKSKWISLYPTMKHDFSNLDSCMLEIEKNLMNPDYLVSYFSKERDFYLGIKLSTLLTLVPIEFHFVKYCFYHQMNELQFYRDNMFGKTEFKQIEYFVEYFATCLIEYSDFKRHFDEILLKSSFGDHFKLCLILERFLNEKQMSEYFKTRVFDPKWIELIKIEEICDLKCKKSTVIKCLFLELVKFDVSVFESIPEMDREVVVMYLLKRIQRMDILDSKVPYCLDLQTCMNSKRKYLQEFPKIGFRILHASWKTILLLCVKNELTAMVEEILVENPALKSIVDQNEGSLEIIDDSKFDYSVIKPLDIWDSLKKVSFTPHSTTTRGFLFAQRIFPLLQHTFQSIETLCDQIENGPERVINILNQKLHFDLSRLLLRNFNMTNQYMIDRVEMDRIIHCVKNSLPCTLDPLQSKRYFVALKPDLGETEGFYKLFGKEDKLFKLKLKQKNLYICKSIPLSVENLILNEEIGILTQFKEFLPVYQSLFLMYAEKSLQEPAPLAPEEKSEFLISSVVSLIKKSRYELTGNIVNDEKMRSRHQFTHLPNVKIAIQFFQLGNVTQIPKFVMNLKNFYVLEQILMYFKNEKLLGLLNIYKWIVYENCSITFQELVEKPPRLLRDRLIEEDLLNIALELAKISKIETDPIWISWGISCLKMGQYKVAREKFKSVTVLSKMTLMNIFNLLTDWNEIRYYLTFLKDENEYMDILLKNHQYSLALTISKSFLNVLKHALDYENLNEFIPLLNTSMLMTSCKYLSDKRDYQHLYHFQRHLQDDSRCAMTMISLYLDTRQNSNLDLACEHLLRCQKEGKTELLTYAEISNYISSIQLQKEITMFLPQVNDPHLFGNIKMKYEIAEALFLKQFGLANKVIAFYQLNIMKLVEKFEKYPTEVISLLHDRYPNDMDDVYLFYCKAKYVQLIVNKGKRLKGFIKLKDWRSAFSLAQSLNSASDMYLIHEGTRNDPTAKQIHEYSKKFIN